MSLKHGTYKLKLHIVQLVMDTEKQKKQLEKKKLKKDKKHIGIQIKHSLGQILYKPLFSKLKNRLIVD